MTLSTPIAQTTQIATVARRAQTKTNARISLDIGYHTCVAYDGQQVSTLRSVYAKLPIGQKAPTLPNTFTVQFGGDRYLVGEGALTQRNYLPFANEDKLSASHPEDGALRLGERRQSRSRHLALQRRRVR